MDPDHLLHSARKAFPYYYSRASVEDTRKLDALVMISAAVLVGIHAPRPEPGPLRAELERKTDSAEVEFMEHPQGGPALPDLFRTRRPGTRGDRAYPIRGSAGADGLTPRSLRRW